MPRFRWDHSKSQEWRRRFTGLIRDELGLDLSMLETYGVVTRIYQGQLYYEQGNTSIEWVPKGHEFRQPLYRRTPIVVKVKSDDPEITTPYTVLVNVSQLLGEERQNYLIISPGDEGKIIYEIADADGHSCRDTIFNIILKKIPTVCKHNVAAIFAVQEGITQSIQEERLEDEIKLLKLYNPLPQEFKDFEDTLPADLNAIERTEVLYQFLKGDVKVFKV
jgi:hypothetical protein